VLFVGCGPGAADLLTLRAVRALAAADIVVWSPSLIAAEVVREHVRPGTEILAWPPAALPDVLDAFDRARDRGLVVVRLKGGDPMLFGAMEPELGAARDRGLDVEIVPGVSALGAAAAALGWEIARPGTPLLVGDAVEAPGGEVGVTALFMAGGGPGAAAAGLRQRGMRPDASCAVAIHVSRADEILVTCRLDELTEHVEDLGRGGHTLVLVRAKPAGETAASGSAPTD